VGFAINVFSGVVFVGAQPLVYLLNPAFQLKILFIMIAGLNATVFWALRRRAEAILPGENTPFYFKMIAATSLCLWIAVMAAGRLLPVFRPVEPTPPIF
jgi:hypothetical protein